MVIHAQWRAQLAIAKVNLKSACNSIVHYLSVVCLLLPLVTSKVLADDSEETDFRPHQLEAIKQDQVDQVDPRGGNLTVKHKDLVLPGNGGMDIVVWRTYNLNAVSAGMASTHNQSFRWTALGPGWSLGVAPRLVMDHHYTRPISNTTAIYYRASYLKSICDNGTYDAAGYPHGAVWSSNILPVLELPDGRREELYFVGNRSARSKGGWKLDCISNHVTATAPNGTLYDFGQYGDRYIGKSAISTADADFRGQGPDNPTRTSSYMMAKTAKDVNGNTLTYTYQMFGTAIAKWTMPGQYQGPGLGLGMPDDPAYIEKPSLKLTQVSASDGRSVNFTYNTTNGRLISMVDNTGRTWSYSYLTPSSNNSRVLSKVALPTGLEWNYDYYTGPFNTGMVLSNANAAARKLRSITYPAGGVVTYEYGYYNAALTNCGRLNGERIKKRTLSTGESWNYSYSRGGAGQYDTTTETGPDGITTYKFMGVGHTNSGACGGGFWASNNAWQVGQLMKKTYPSGNTETYDWRKRLIAGKPFKIVEIGEVHDQNVWAADLEKKTIVRDGATYTTDYSNFDAYGNPGTVIESGPNGSSRTTTLTYLNDTAKWIIGKPQNETSPTDTITRSFDSNGNLLSLTKNGVTTSYTYDAYGNVATETRPRGLLYSYSNYKHGIPQSEAQPEGINLARVVDDAGNVTSETNGEGKTTTYTYDGLNRVTSITHPIGNPKTVVYTPTTKTTTRGDLVETTVADPFGNVASVTLGDITTNFVYDALGRKIFESSPGDSTTGTAYEYDSHNRITRITNADSTFQTHTYGAGTKSVTDERSNTTTYTYRAYGDPDKPLLMAITAPELSANVAITRNVKDLVESVTQGGQTRTYGYDSRNYLTSVTNPETGTTTYVKDAADNMTSRTIGGDATTYTYDGQNRPVSTVYPGTTPSVLMTYTKTNKLKTVVSSAASRSYTYDNNDNLFNETVVVDGITLSTQNTYNANDQLASITYPYSGRVVNFTPDVLGRPITAGDYVDEVAYWPSGQIGIIWYPNNTANGYEQNARLWPSSFLTLIGETFHNSTSYIYDGVGNLTSISDADATDVDHSRTLGYDAINRLVTVDGPWGSGNIAYNGAGNLLSQTFGSSTLSYTYDAQNRLASTSGSHANSYTYDAYGDIATDSSNSYTYDGVPNLRCVNCATANPVEYTYDGLSKRISVTKGGVKTYEIYSSSGNLLAEYTPGLGNKLVEYIYLGNKRVAQHETSATTDTKTYFHNDISGSPMLATDAAGAIIWKETYRPYGEKLTNAPASANNKVGFHGKPHDDSTGLSYMGARYYDPVIGRFTGIDPQSVDPENIHSFNRYAYANNNPYKFVDPDGHSPIDVAFLAYDIGKLGVAVATGGDVGGAAVDVALSAVGVVSPVPGVGQVMKAARVVDRGVDAVNAVDHVADGAKAVGAVAEGAFSKVDDVTKPGSKLSNIKTDVSKSEFENNLLDNGFSKSTSKDGNVNIFTNGDKKYTTRDSSKSTKGPSAEVFINDEKKSKIRLKDQ